jgi:hypothetical protein
MCTAPMTLGLVMCILPHVVKLLGAGCTVTRPGLESQWRGRLPAPLHL